FTGLRPLANGELEALQAKAAAVGVWMDRDAAEGDPRHKQLIPYVVVRDAERVFLMERTDAGADARLHRRATIGVGGHLNPVDDGPDPLGSGLRREWREELEANWEPEFTPIGLLNDDRNPVGSVHLGIVFEVQAAGRPIGVRERHKLSGRMASVAEVGSAWDRLETWSQLLADALWRRPAG
ncbi:MAG: NUDIX domain-containing protein, partial [Candidatus Limnocylindria bacterium]